MKYAKWCDGNRNTSNISWIWFSYVTVYMCECMLLYVIRQILHNYSNRCLILFVHVTLNHYFLIAIISTTQLLKFFFSSQHWYVYAKKNTSITICNSNTVYIFVYIVAAGRFIRSRSEFEWKNTTCAFDMFLFLLNHCSLKWYIDLVLNKKESSKSKKYWIVRWS